MAGTDSVLPAPGHGPDYPERIRRLRAERGLSQTELAEALGVSAVTVRRWEQGRHQPTHVVWRMLLGLESDEAGSPSEAGGEADAGGGLAGGFETRPYNTVPPAPAVPSNLPLALSSFVGRERELSELTSLFRSPATRLLTLTGVGGSGKTRLALALAGAVETQFAAGVCLAELAPLADPTDLPAAVARRSDCPSSPACRRSTS